jgi:hypothetical protein
VVLDLCPTGRLRMGLPPPAELSDDRGAEREVPGQLSLFEE